jgi:hypothetical protein
MYEEVNAMGLKTVFVIVSVRQESMQAHAISIDNVIEMSNVCLSRLMDYVRRPDTCADRARILGTAPPNVIDDAIRHHLNRMRTFRDEELNGTVLMCYMGASLGVKEYVYFGKNKGYNNHDGMWLDVQLGRIGYKPIRCTIVDVKIDMALRGMAWRLMNVIKNGLYQAKNNVAVR